MSAIGFIGLGNMGSALAANLVGAGHTVITHDVAGSQRSPTGARFVPSVAEVAALTSTVVLSLPDGSVSESVSRVIVAAADRQVTHVLDTSTIGVAAAEAIDELLSEAGISYVDAPVSGGVAGAKARTLAVMYAGTAAACDAVEPVLAGLSDRNKRVGERPGMAQALKLANNFLSATALAAASEAVAFGVAVGLDMATMLEVLNTSSGQSAAITDKFFNHILTKRYASGFANTLMSKDLQLYLGEAQAATGKTAFGSVTADVWKRFASADPGVDFTRIYPFVEGS